MCRKYIYTLFFLFAAARLWGITLKVGIFSASTLHSVILSSSVGSYEVYGDGFKIYTLAADNFLQLSVENEKIVVKNFSTGFGEYNTLNIIGVNGDDRAFRVKPVDPSSEGVTFPDNLRVGVSRSSLRLVNFAEIEHYVPGVVEAETGNCPSPEFLKVQSIIVRTYALSNLKRHQDEGFDLCDQVHCQVYRGLPRFNMLAVAAAAATRSLMLMDENSRPVTAAFHSNCGGHTANSEDVWTSSLPYLRSVNDSFCTSQPHANWEKYIPMEEWKNYIERRTFSDNDDAPDSYDTFGNERQKFYTYNGVNIPMKTLRHDWGLRSSYFSIIELNDSILIRGKGYGHGVGLCQEGAMRMSDMGYSYTDIIRFYYRNVSLAVMDTLKITE